MDNQNRTNPLSSPPTAPQGQPTASMNPRQQVATRLRQANNVLITVNSNPTLDELAACIGLTLILNRMGKHAVAVYSGETPEVLDFLEPENTIEKNTDSLRDFIISLDKAKADKLRYKVEDKVVKIFISPYRTSISEKDMEFSQGDVNVDVVIALGVGQQQDVDQAITAHGRILHDATVISISNSPQPGSIGTLVWQDSTISSLSEMVTSLSADLGGRELLDSQIATSLLTGIVAVTSRFSNNKTSPQSLSVSASLLAAGANQQLVAAKLEPPTTVPFHPPVTPAPTPKPKPELKPAPSLPQITTMAATKPRPKEEEEGNGMLHIDHANADGTTDITDLDQLTEEERLEQIRIDNQGVLHHKDDEVEILSENSTGDNSNPVATPPVIDLPKPETPASLPPSSEAPMAVAPTPSILPGATITAASDPDADVVVTSEDDDVPTSVMPTTPLLSHDTPRGTDYNKETLTQIEEDVHSPHLTGSRPDLSSASQSASDAATSPLGRVEALGASDLGNPLHDSFTGSALPNGLLPPNDGPPTPPTSNGSDPTSPPPVPPPMIPPDMPGNGNEAII